MTPTDLVNILFRASQAKVGLLLRTSDPKRAMAAFVRARESNHDVELPPVTFRELQGHPEGNLVLLSSSGAKALRANGARANGPDATDASTNENGVDF